MIYELVLRMHAGLTVYFTAACRPEFFKLDSPAMVLSSWTAQDKRMARKLTPFAKPIGQLKACFFIA